jgi:hypothetical protein
MHLYIINAYTWAHTRHSSKYCSITLVSIFVETGTTVIGPSIGVLDVRGDAVDEITEVSSPMRRIWEVHEFWLYKHWDIECRTTSWRVSSYPTGEPPETAHWRTRVGNLSPKGRCADASLGRSYTA